MSLADRRFDDLLPNIRADSLKSMMRLWGGGGSLPKDQCIARIRAGLSDPGKVRAAVATLDPYEQAALSLFKLHGGVIDVTVLDIAIAALGVTLPARLRNEYSRSGGELTRLLIRRGLALTTYPRDPTYLGISSGGQIFCDQRLYAHAGPLQPQPLPLQSQAPPTTTLYRRPSAVSLDLIGMVQAIANLPNGLALTQKGSIHNSDERKLKRALRWGDEFIEVDGLRFPDPGGAFIGALRHSGWLQHNGDRLLLTASPTQLAQRPYVEQVAGLVQGFLRNYTWQEQLGYTSSYYAHHFGEARLALTILLQALPTDAAGFFAVADLDQALYNRIGEFFSFKFVPHKPYGYGKSPEEIRKLEAEWRAKLRANWLEGERQWLDQALRTWLYFLGIVELGWEGQHLVSVRLTELGRALFHPQIESPTVSDLPSQPTRQSAWVVQPNFDLVVYLEQTTPTQLAFLEGHAERSQAQQHLAHYRLTRESIYRGLESGSTLSAILDALQAGAQTPLPQNVIAEIKAWAGLREQITLHRRMHLREFPSAAARQAWLAQGGTGQAVGDRFLLLPVDAPTPAAAAITRIDYRRPLPACLTVSEQGLLQRQEGYADLLIEAQLDQWAERQSPQEWLLTAARVHAAVKAGATLGQLLDWLKMRLTHPLPALLKQALTTWAGIPLALELETVTLLHCPSNEVLQTLENSSLLRPFLRGRLSAELLVVDTAGIAALREHLTWAGARVVDGLPVKRLR